MKWFQNFMRGRYGVDQLSFALLILYFVITILGTAFRIPYIGYVALLLIVWCWFRILSRNTYKRSQENAKFMGWIYPIQNKWRTKKREFQDRKTHKYYNCPNCKQRLRVSYRQIPEGSFLFMGETAISLLIHTCVISLSSLHPAYPRVPQPMIKPF